MDRIEGFSIGLNLDTIRVETGLKDLRSQLRLADSEMKANLSTFNRGDKSIGKYETSVKGLNKRLEVQKQITDKAQKSYEKMVKEHGEGSIEADKAARNYNNQSANLNNLKRDLVGTSKELAKLQKQQHLATTGWGKFGKRMEGLSGRMEKLGSGMQQAGSSITSSFGIATAAVGGGLALATKKAMDFESQISSMKSVMSPTEVKEFGGSLEKLAIDMGAKTKYSAIEAAEGIEELVKAGVAVKDIMKGGLEGALNLATAGELELADAAEIASTALNAFKDDNISVTRAADLLAGAANASATDVGELKYSLSAVSAVASGVGLSFEDTSSALAVFAQNGLKGSDAGTSLKTMLLRLSPQTDKAYEAFDQLGLATYNNAAGYKYLISKGIKPATRHVADIEKGLEKLTKQELGSEASKAQLKKRYEENLKASGLMSSAFYDENGELKSMAEIAQLLKTSMADLNDEQRQNYLNAMFGSDAIRGANILYKEGAKGVKKMNKAMNEITAAEVAAEKMRNLKGAIEELGGSFETAQVSIGSALIPALQGLTNTVKGIVEIFNGFPQALQKTIAIGLAATAGVLALATGIGLLLTVAGGAISGMGALTGVIGKMSMSAATGTGILAKLRVALLTLTGPVGIAIGLAAALGVGLVIAYKKSETFRNIVNGLRDAFLNVVNKIKEFLTTNKIVLAVIDRLKKNFEITKSVVLAAVGAIADFFKQKISEMKTFWDQNGEKIKQAFSNIFTAIKAVVGPIISGIGVVIKTTLSVILSVVKAVLPVIKGIFSITFKLIFAIVKSIWSNIEGVISGALKVITGTVKIFSGLFTGDFKQMWSGIKDVFVGALQFIWNFVQLMMWGKLLKGILVFGKLLIGGFKGMWSGIQSVFTTVIRWIVDFVKKTFTSMGTSTFNIFKSIFNFYRTIWTSIFKFLQNIVLKIFNAVKSAWKWVYDTTKQRFQNVFEITKNTFTKVKDFISGAVGKVREGVSGAWNKVLDKTKTVFKAVFDTVKKRFGDVVQAAKDLPGRIGSGISKMASKVGKGITDLKETMIDKLKGALNGVINGINWVLDKLNIDKKNWLQTWNGKSKVKEYAKGTGYGGHPEDGPALVGDGRGRLRGPELIRTPDGKSFLSPAKDTLVNMPKGTHVWSAPETRNILSGVPAYKNGTKKKKNPGRDLSALEQFGSGKFQEHEMKKKADKTAKKAIKDVWDMTGKAALNLGLKTLGIKKPDGDSFAGKLARAGWNKIKSGAGSFIEKERDAAVPLSQGISFGEGFTRTSGFGPRWGTHHAGLDFAAALGSKIRAQAAGTVAFSGFGKKGNGFTGYGNTVLIKGGGGYSYLYGHNSKNLVKSGDAVSKGDIIGLVGSTGDSTGPHVHFEVRKDGKAINPDAMTGGGASGGAKAWSPQIKRAAMQMNENVSLRELNGVVAQIHRESRGNQSIIQSPLVRDINTLNGNPAKGLLQYIPQTFRKYAMKGHSNIFNGYDQLLAFFNNTKWRSDLPYGRRGWGPTGARKFATGGLIKASGLYNLAEGGFPEWVIPTDPARRTDAMKLLALAGRDIEGKNKRPNQLPNVNSSGTGGSTLEKVLAATLEQNAFIREQNELLRMIAGKDLNVYMDGRQVGKVIEPHITRKQEKDQRARLRGMGIQA